MKYTQTELDDAALRDLIVDAECAERDGHSNYAAHCRALIAKYSRGGAHEVVLKGEGWTGETPTVNCDQCEMLSINGIACHERGCSNNGARWDGEQWIKQRECFECGCTVDADAPCCESDDDLDSPAESKHWFSTGSGRIEIALTLEDAQSGSHQGQCDDDVRALSRVPYVAEQLDALNADTLAAELKEYGAWDDSELSDHDQNLQRILWLACGDIAEEAQS